jgi:hypothetical protein
MCGEGAEGEPGAAVGRTLDHADFAAAKQASVEGIEQRQFDRGPGTASRPLWQSEWLFIDGRPVPWTRVKF